VEDHDARLDLSVLSRIKLFYRPQAITIASQHPLRFRITREEDEPWLLIHNPAPVHQTLGHVRLRSNDTALALDAPILPPFSSARVRLPDAAITALQQRTGSTAGTLEFSVIDDDGNWINDAQTLPH